MNKENDMSDHEERPYMDGIGILAKTEELNEAAWDALPLAWLGVSGGLMMSLGSIFWRFVVYPPRLVIRYGEGDEVWAFGDKLYRDGMPDVGYTADIVCLLLVAIGVALIMVSSAPWRRAIREVRAHTARMKAETAKRGKGWARS